MSEAIIINILVEDSIYGLEGPQVALFGDLKFLKRHLPYCVLPYLQKELHSSYLDLIIHTQEFLYMNWSFLKKKNPVYQVI